MVSPLNAPDKLDYKGIERLVDHILLGGVHGLFILGTTGEAPSLSRHLKREMIKHSCSLVSKRVPILVGITDTSSVESIKLADYAADAGADALVLAPPLSANEFLLRTVVQQASMVWVKDSYHPKFI